MTDTPPHTRWLRIIGVPFLFLMVGFGLGLMARETLAPPGRFVMTDTSTSVILDSKTGQYCFAGPVSGNSPFPHCLDLYRKC